MNEENLKYEKAIEVMKDRLEKGKDARNSSKQNLEMEMKFAIEALSRAQNALQRKENEWNNAKKF